MTTARAPFDAATPDRLNFTFPAALGDPRSPGTPSSPISLSSESPLDRTRQKFNKLYRSAKDVVKNNTGMLLVAASQGFFALMNVAVKKLNSLDEPVSAMQLISVRMGITWICCVTYMYFMKVPDPFLGPKGVRLLLAFRGFVGFFGLFGVYYSLQYLSLSDATVLTFLAPMGASVTGALFLKESLTWRQVVASLFSLVGVVLIARPAALFGRVSELEDIPIIDGVEGVDITPHVTPSQRLTAVGVALIGVLGAIGAYTTIRAIGKRAHPLHNLVSFSSQCIIVSTVAMIIMKTKYVVPLRIDWLAMLLMIGIFGFLAQVLLTMGLQRETVGRGTMAVYTQVVYALTFDHLFFYTSPSPLSVVGTLIIVFSALYVAITKENTGKHKRARSLMPSAEDVTLEEGLLAGAEHDDDVESESAVKVVEAKVIEQEFPQAQHERPRSSSNSSSSSSTSLAQPA